MIQLQVITGKMAGEKQIVRHFPFHIGRLPDNHLCLDEPGVWDHHLTIEFLKNEGYFLSAAPDAFTTVNDQPQVTTRLVSGDAITFGSVRIQFWLAPARQRALFTRELGVWLLIIGMAVLQAVLLVLLVG